MRYGGDGEAFMAPSSNAQSLALQHPIVHQARLCPCAPCGRLRCCIMQAGYGVNAGGALIEPRSFALANAARPSSAALCCTPTRTCWPFCAAGKPELLQLGLLNALMGALVALAANDSCSERPAAGAESQLDAKRVNPPHRKGAGMPVATAGCSLCWLGCLTTLVSLPAPAG